MTGGMIGIDPSELASSLAELLATTTQLASLTLEVTCIDLLHAAVEKRRVCLPELKMLILYGHFRKLDGFALTCPQLDTLECHVSDMPMSIEKSIITGKDRAPCLRRSNVWRERWRVADVEGILPSTISASEPTDVI